MLTSTLAQDVGILIRDLKPLVRDVKILVRGVRPLIRDEKRWPGT